MAEKRPKGVPADARQSSGVNVGFMQSVNAMLKKHGVRIRAKATQRGGGVPSWIWVEKLEQPPLHIPPDLADHPAYGM